jgi:hypothetical protein
MIEEAVSEEIKAQEICTQQFVRIVKTNAKYHSNHQKTDLYIAEIVLESTRSFKFIFLEIF